MFRLRLRPGYLFVFTAMLAMTVFAPTTYAAATITSFSPTTGVEGDEVTLIGSNLNNILSVDFNGTDASFQRMSSTEVRATVPWGATTGPITVNTLFDGNSSTPTDFVIAPPAITSISPKKLVPGAQVSIFGSNFTGATEVTFNGISASFWEWNGGELRAIVPNQVTSSGTLQVETNGGAATAAFIRVPGFIANPDFDEGTVNWTPENGLLISRSSEDASGVAGSGSLLATQISTFYAAHHVGQCVRVTSPGQLHALWGKTKIPTNQPTGSSELSVIWWSGTNCTGFITNDYKHNISSGTWQYLSRMIPAPAGAQSAKVNLVVWRSGNSTDPFTVQFDEIGFDLAGAPVITGHPTLASFGEQIVISGANFQDVSAVTVNNAAAMHWVNGPGQLVAVVPNAASNSGFITVTTPAGTVTSSQQLFIKGTPPQINSIQPSAAKPGDTVTISGQYFRSPSVKFGGVASTSVTVLSPQQLQVVVPSISYGALHDVTVTNNDTTSKTSPALFFSMFSDVSTGHPLSAYVEEIFRKRITTGCGGGLYCPGAIVLREQMAAFIARARAASDANVPATGSVNGNPYSCSSDGSADSNFGDVAATSPFCRHIHFIAAENVTAGCAPGSLFCPAATTSRAAMAAFVGRALNVPNGDAGIPDAVTLTAGVNPWGLPRAYSCVDGNPSTNAFSDVPDAHLFCKQAHYLWARGIIDGYPDGTFGPENSVSRIEVAKFLANAF